MPEIVIFGEFVLNMHCYEKKNVIRLIHLWRILRNSFLDILS